EPTTMMLLVSHTPSDSLSRFFCFNAPATTEIYTLSLHDALPILQPTPTPGPEVNVIGYCPDYVEVLKDTITACNDDKLDVLEWEDRKSTRLNSSHVKISYAVFCLKKKKKKILTICIVRRQT